ncbi:MAG: GNAT family N-acetyltransferase [Proteobacteria bacterium]|nr:GNAT family N-acetyltransferase [Pseudomonadota bacterium]
MNQLIIKELQLGDEVAFLAMTQASKTYHHPWVKAPITQDEFIDYFNRSQKENQKSYLLFLENEIVGVFNISEIVKGNFHSAFLGFYGAQKYARKGFMSQGLKLVLHKVFHELALHRLEANIQPGNSASILLVQHNGFRKEGYSPRYLKINEKWCDHERWALTIEDWRQHD